MRHWKETLLIGAVTVLLSEVYWNIFSDDFRVSIAVAVLPVLLMTLGREQISVRTGLFTGAFVFLFRFWSALIGGQAAVQAAAVVLPGALFYVCYGILFALLVKNKHTVPFPWLMCSIALCDLFSNFFEVALRSHLATAGLGERFVYLVQVACVRTLVAGGLLAMVARYRALLSSMEHEHRYQRLFLMSTGLKNEVYFMKKNSEEVERIMANAYQLYEQCTALELPEHTRRLALAIARDVHEIKKDYIRIIEGMEKQIDEQCDRERMRCSDLLTILKDSTYRTLAERGRDIRLDFACQGDFVTGEHYSLMAVLMNLVNNAVEAIESGAGHGTIRLRQERLGEAFLFRVADDGPGIPEKNLQNIFQMGFSTKFDNRTGNIYRGVGLSGVRLVVEEQFGGTISVSTGQGRGTEFCLELPAAALEAKED